MSSTELALVDINKTVDINIFFFWEMKEWRKQSVLEDRFDCPLQIVWSIASHYDNSGDRNLMYRKR